MSSSEQGAPDYLTEALERAPLPDGVPADRLVVVAELVGLAGLEGAPEEGRENLDALCRKVHVARRVDASYGPGWKKLADRQPLDVAAHPLLVAVLLANGERVAQRDRGYSLKLLNAAVAALELAEAAGANGLEAVRVESERQLARALEELSS